MIPWHSVVLEQFLGTLGAFVQPVFIIELDEIVYGFGVFLISAIHGVADMVEAEKLEVERRVLWVCALP